MNIKEIKKTVYVAVNGKEFEDRAECEKYEHQLAVTTQNRLKKMKGIASTLSKFCKTQRESLTIDDEEDGICGALECPFRNEYKRCALADRPYAWKE